MSAGDFTPAFYQTENGAIYRIRVQPETLTLSIASVVNASATGPAGQDTPSARVGSGRNSFGVNAKLVRIRFTGTVPDGYSGGKDTITLPVLTNAAFAAYQPQAVGTYTLNGTAYDVVVVGRTPESIK